MTKINHNPATITDISFEIDYSPKLQVTALSLAFFDERMNAAYCIELPMTDVIEAFKTVFADDYEALLADWMPLGMFGESEESGRESEVVTNHINCSTTDEEIIAIYNEITKKHTSLKLAEAA